ncbi:MAG: hypothetical protein Q8O32_02465, partial [bacterium]|nr:hypothetical protein [bacterium]
MNFDKPIINILERKYTQKRIDALKEIETPEELFAFMRDNIKYGFVGKEGGKIYSPEYEGWGEGEQPEQELQSPEELLESLHGTCWEQTEFARQWFSKNNFDFKTFILISGSEISQKNPAHTFLAFSKGDKWYWFENSLDEYNGVHEFDSLDSLIEDVKSKIINNAI